MHFVGILNSGWVILKEKSISQIILHRRIMTNKTKRQTIFNQSMKECLISRFSKHILLIPHAKTGANICQKYCSKLSYWPPEGCLGLKSCDHVQVRCDIWNLLSLKIDHGTEKGTNSARQYWPSTRLFTSRGSHFHTLMLEFLPKRERDDPQMGASAAYILVWADRWKVQFSAILNDN